MATKTARAPRSAEPEKVRGTLGRVIRDVFDETYLREFAESVKTMTAGVWASGVCPDCGSQKKVRVDVPDLKGQIAAWTELMEQAEGRPGLDSTEQQGTTLIVERPAR